MSTRIRVVLLVVLLVAGLIVLTAVPPSGRDPAMPQTASATRIEPRQPPLPRDAVVTETAHYRVHSTANAAQTTQVARAVESLYASYAAMFPPQGGKTGKLTLVLYRDRAEFKRNNHSRPWAEAYYLAPRSYAYFDATARNPYHWMLHEATHQLMRETSRFPRTKWIDEGVASYFGSSRLTEDGLRLGDADPGAYPIWWLSGQTLTGNLEQDIAAGQIIPLEQLIRGRGGPDENRYFNLYYLHYWSLTHFLFHYRDGVYADRYKQLIAAGGSLDNFRRIIGPPERVQVEWYAYLQQLLAAAGADGAMQGDTVILYEQSATR